MQCTTVHADTSNIGPWRPCTVPRGPCICTAVQTSGSSVRCTTVLLPSPVHLNCHCPTISCSAVLFRLAVAGRSSGEQTFRSLLLQLLNSSVSSPTQHFSIHTRQCNSITCRSSHSAIIITPASYNGYEGTLELK